MEANMQLSPSGSPTRNETFVDKKQLLQWHRKLLGLKSEVNKLLEQDERLQKIIEEKFAAMKQKNVPNDQYSALYKERFSLSTKQSEVKRAISDLTKEIKNLASQVDEEKKKRFLEISAEISKIEQSISESKRKLGIVNFEIQSIKRQPLTKSDELRVEASEKYKTWMQQKIDLEEQVQKLESEKHKLNLESAFFDSVIRPRIYDKNLKTVPAKPHLEKTIVDTEKMRHVRVTTEVTEKVMILAIYEKAEKEYEIQYHQRGRQVTETYPKGTQIIKLVALEGKSLQDPNELDLVVERNSEKLDIRWHYINKVKL